MPFVNSFDFFRRAQSVLHQYILRSPEKGKPNAINALDLTLTGTAMPTYEQKR